MDLNIGTAFWFAAGGEGYLKEYSEEDHRSVYSGSRAGRPILRRGGEDAARSVGLQEYPKTITGNKQRKVPAKVQGHDAVSCSNTSVCFRVAKANCIYKLCSRCCRQKQSNDNNIGNIEILVCSAHKSKKSTRERKSNNIMMNDMERVNKDNSNVSNNSKNSNDDNNEITESKDDFIEADVNMSNQSKLIESHQYESYHNNNISENLSKYIPNTSISNEIATTFARPQESLVAVNDGKTPYKSTARALLVGCGADEQLAGYGRHRSCYLRGGEEVLCEELNMDCERLWKRNLGRYDC